LRGGGATIDGDQAGIDVADLAVFGLNAGEVEAIDQDGKALAARQGCDDLGCTPGFSEDLSGICMIIAVYVAHFVSPSG